MIDVERFSCAAGFVRQAVENGAYLYPPLKKRNRNSWDRHLDITLMYYFGEREDKNGSRSLTCKEVGGIFPALNRPLLSKAGVSQIIISTLSYLRSIYPDDFEKFFPKATLFPRIGKPAFLYDSTARNIALCIEEDMKYPELAKTFDAHQLETARGKLRPFGIAVPYQNEEQTQRKSLAEELAKVGPDTDIDTLKRLIDRASTQSSHSNRNDLLKKYFIPLTTLLREVGIRIDRKAGDLDPLVLKLRAEDYPVGIYSRIAKKGSKKEQLLRYLIVYRMQQEAIKTFLLA